MKKDKRTFEANKIYLDLVYNLCFHILTSNVDSIGFLNEQIIYFHALFSGKEDGTPILQDLIKKSILLKPDILFLENGSTINGKDFLNLGDSYIKSPEKFMVRKDISERTKKIAEAIIAYSFYIIELLDGVPKNSTPKAYLFKGQKDLLFKAKQIENNNKTIADDFVSEIKKQVYDSLIISIEILFTDKNIEERKGIKEQQEKLVKLSLNGDVEAMKRMYIFKDDFINLYSLSNSMKKIADEYNKYGDVDKLNFQRDPQALYYCGFTLAFIQYRNHLEKLNSTLNKSNLQKILTDSNDSAIAFKWIGARPETQIKYLFAELSEENGFISTDDFEKFETAFSGGRINEPLKIQWQCLTKNRRDSSKADLISFIELLGAHGFLSAGEISNTSYLFKKIEFIFCNFNGTPFKNLTGSNYQKREITLHGKILENIIKHIPK